MKIKREKGRGRQRDKEEKGHHRERAETQPDFIIVIYYYCLVECHLG